MFPSIGSRWMSLVAIVAGVCTVTLAAPRQTDKLWTCPKEPVACLSPASASKRAECQENGDCQMGAQCCYRGCVKRCRLSNPCDKVVCKDGNICRTRETPCLIPPCQLEATCVPASDVVCRIPACNTSDCQPGFARANDSNGCATCQCVQKTNCAPTCTISCAHGYEKKSDGCPKCLCKPDPQNPCSDKQCGPSEECRFVQVHCIQAPCEPIATCVNKTTAEYENACSLSSPTAVGLPVIDLDGTTELDCYHQLCPDNTICMTMRKGINRCCWQSTQDKVLKPPKAGECPQEYMINFSALTLKCQVDGICPGEQKCCYKQTNMGPSRYYGYCMDPIHKIIQNASAECQRSAYLKVVFKSLGLC